MKIRLFIFLAIAGLFLGSCNRQEALTERDLELIGSWSSADFYLIIAANGYGFCQERNGRTIEGWVDIDDDRLTFRDNQRRERFDLDEAPFREDDRILMVLDGELFYKH